MKKIFLIVLVLVFFIGGIFILRKRALSPEAGERPPDGGIAAPSSLELLGGWVAYRFPDGSQEIVAINNFGTPIGMGNPPSLAEANYECSDWWHNLSWADWWREDGRLNNVWYSFDIDFTAAHEKTLEVSREKCRLI